MTATEFIEVNGTVLEAFDKEGNYLGTSHVVDVPGYHFFLISDSKILGWELEGVNLHVEVSERLEKLSGEFRFGYWASRILPLKPRIHLERERGRYYKKKEVVAKSNIIGKYKIKQRC